MIALTSYTDFGTHIMHAQKHEEGLVESGTAEVSRTDLMHRERLLETCSLELDELNCIRGFSALCATAACLQVFPELCAMADCSYGLSAARLMGSGRRNGGLYLWIFRTVRCGCAAADRLSMQRSRRLAAATEFSTNFNCSPGGP